MDTPILTIGMATYDDFHGVWPTVQSLRLYHAEVMSRSEIIVVDNNPNSDHGKNCLDFLNGWVKNDVVRTQYLPLQEPVGTSASRDRIFHLSTGKYVLCMDCHVLIVPGALAKTLDYFEANPETNDLISGPLLYDDGVGISTHFADEWRAEMWGTWATDQRGEDPNGEPFEIPANGLGVFACRKEAWQGFSKHFRGFGGEEFYIHEKFRKAGGKCLCLPWLRWMHRFGRPDGTPYPLTRKNKVRNYVIGHKEVGIPLDRLRSHFVDQGLTSVEEWNELNAEANQLLAADAAPPEPPPLPPVSSQAVHFAKAIAAHVLDGCKKASQPVFAERLMHCQSCDRLNEDHCSLCGCPVIKKAAWRSEQCPINKWRETNCQKHREPEGEKAQIAPSEVS